MGICYLMLIFNNYLDLPFRNDKSFWYLSSKRRPFFPSQGIYIWKTNSWITMAVPKLASLNKIGIWLNWFHLWERSWNAEKVENIRTARRFQFNLKPKKCNPRSYLVPDSNSIIQIQANHQRVQYPRSYPYQKLQIVLCRLYNFMKWTKHEKIHLSTSTNNICFLKV